MLSIADQIADLADVTHNYHKWVYIYRGHASCEHACHGRAYHGVDLTGVASNRHVSHRCASRRYAYHGRLISIVVVDHCFWKAFLEFRSFGKDLFWNIRTLTVALSHSDNHLP
jgi:hypothetical protein